MSLAARARTTTDSSTVRPPRRRASRWRRCARTSASPRGQAARTAAKTSSGKRMRFSSVPPYSSVRWFDLRREEAREQVAVRHVQLDHVEARAFGHAHGARRWPRARRPCRRAPSRAARASRARRAAPRDRSSARPGHRAAGRRPPRAGCRKPCARRARAGCRSSRACARARSRRCASRPRRAPSAYIPVQPGVMRPSARDVRSSRRSPAPRRRPRGCRGARGASRSAAPSLAEYWHIGRDHDAILELHAAQLERREHRRRRPTRRARSAMPASSREPLAHAAHQLRIALAEVVAGDALASASSG